MAYVTPNSRIELFAGVPLNKDAEDTLYFDTVEEQNRFFGEIPVGGTGRTDTIFPIATYPDCVYIKETGKVRVEPNNTLTYAAIETINYMRFKNTSYGNKWFYAFINSTELRGNGTLEIAWEIDPLQTWLPTVDYSLTECRILRQHQTGSDDIGDNLQPENIQVIDYSPAVLYTESDENRYADELDVFAGGYYIAVLFPYTTQANQGVNWNMIFCDSTREDPTQTPPITACYNHFPLVQTIDGTLCGDLVFLFDPTETLDRERLQIAYSYWGSEIIDSWVIPKSLIDEDTYVTTRWIITDAVLPANRTIQLRGKSIFYGHYTGESDIPYASDGEIKAREITYSYRTGSMDYLPDLPSQSNAPYAIRNKKLLTNPYCFYSITSPNGETRQLSFEKMLASHINQTLTDYTPYVKVIGSILNTKISIIPIAYDESPYAYDKQQGLPLAPVGSVHGLIDTSEQSKIISTVMQTGFGTAGTIFGGVLGGTVGTTIGQTFGGAIGMAMNKVTERVGGGGVYNVNDIGIWGNGLRKFVGTKQYAINFKEIDQYFDAYGYTQNTYAIPDLTHRRYFTFIQTDNANLKPISINADNMKKINDRFNKGIRFHKNAYTIGNITNYAAQNGIVTP